MSGLGITRTPCSGSIPPSSSITQPGNHGTSLHFQLLLQLQELGQVQHIPPQLAMMDCGAAANFIVAKGAKTLQISLLPKPAPDLVEMIDGSPLLLGPVTQETIPLKAIVEGHQETICFSVIRSPFFLKILSIPWLE